MIREVKETEEWLREAISYYYDLVDSCDGAMPEEIRDAIWDVNFDWLLVFETLILKRLKNTFPVFNTEKGDMHLVRHILGPDEAKHERYTPLRDYTLMRVYWHDGPSTNEVVKEIREYLAEIGVRNECLDEIKIDTARGDNEETYRHTDVEDDIHGAWIEVEREDYSNDETTVNIKAHVWGYDEPVCDWHPYKLQEGETIDTVLDRVTFIISSSLIPEECWDENENSWLESYEDMDYRIESAKDWYRKFSSECNPGEVVTI